MLLRCRVIKPSMGFIMTLAVKIDNLSKSFAHQPIVQNVHLHIAKGKTLLLYAGNGTGKTTLLQLISSSLRPTSGSIKVFGYDTQHDAAKVRQHIAYLSVLGGNYDDLSAWENLQLAAKLYHKKEEVIPHWLETVDLLAARDKLVRTFSSGMKKRLALARVLLADMPLWLLDEPYTALDEAGCCLVDTLLEQAKTEGRTVVFASHQLERSQRHADSMVGLQDAHLSLLPV